LSVINDYKKLPGFGARCGCLNGNDKPTKRKLNNRLLSLDSGIIHCACQRSSGVGQQFRNLELEASSHCVS